VSRILRLPLGIVILSLALVGSVAAWMPALAQDDGWSQPMLVFENRGLVSHPSLIADKYGQVHAFWVFTQDSNSGDGAKQIYYDRLDLPDAQPVDIYVGKGNFASLNAVGNREHLFVMWDGNFLSEASPAPALSAQAWAQPNTIASAYSQSGLTVGADDSLWLGYGDNTINSIFVRRLNPQTGAWGLPDFVSNTSNTSAAPDAVKMTIAADGSLHVVWTEYQLPNGWPPLGVYYSHSEDGGQNWSAARQMAGNGFNTPNVLAGTGKNLYMTWIGMGGIGGKYFAQSTDEGTTWSGATNLLNTTQGGGSEGAPNMVLDSLGTLHVLFSDNNCVWYLHLDINGWTTPDCISHGVPTSHTEQPIMTIGLGNRLHVMWWTNDRQLWYTSRQLTTPGQTIQPTPTAIVATEVPPTATPAPVPTATHIPDYGAAMDPSLPAQSGAWAVIAGIVPVVLLVGIVALRRLNK